MPRLAHRKGRVNKGRAASGVSPEAGRHEPGRWWLEPLEPRLLLSALVIQGTAGDDIITVSQDVTGVTVVTQLGTDFYPGSFSSITVDGLAGNDIIRLMHSVSTDHFVYGGEGNDAIFDAAIGAGQVHGGEGDDLLVTVGGGLHVLSGGGGSDSFWCDGADTIGDADYAESFRNVHVVQEFYQPYTTDPQSPDYVSLDIDGQNFQDPTAGGYQSFAGTPLFVDGPQYDDAVQGSLGDCYFISALASLADAVPEVIEQAIAPLGDGTYAVRFYRNWTENFIRVDADLPASGSAPTYAKLGADGELWVPLIEKAYAYFRYGQNSYISLAGGWPGTVYTEISASDATSIWTGLPDATVTDFLSTHLAAGRAVSAPSLSNASSPIAASHSYMVKSMRTVESTTYVMLYNPWGSLIEITLSQLKSNFGMLTASLAGDSRFPVAVDDSAVTEFNSPVTIDVLANDSDPEGDPLSIKSVGWPSHGMTQDNGDGTITYTPAGGFVGVDTFTYTLTDGNGGLAQAGVTVNVFLDADAPWVSKVMVSSSSWSQAFLDALGDVGFAVPAGPPQFDAIPWNNIDRISMVFSEDVNLSQDDLRVYGLNVPEYAIAALDYDSVTRTATWTLRENVDSDVLQLVLSDAVVAPSGNGSSGGDFQMRINVLPGDGDGDGTVGAGDLTVFISLFGGSAIGADFDGSGAVDAADYIMLKRNFGRSLPAPPQAPSAAPLVILTAAPPAEISADGQTGDGAAETTPLMELAAWRSLQGRPQFGKLSAGAGLSVPDSKGLPVSLSQGRTMLHDSDPIDVLRISRAGAKLVGGFFTSRSGSPACADAEQAGSGEAPRQIMSSVLAPARLRIMPSRLGIDMPTILAQPGLDIL